MIMVSSAHNVYWAKRVLQSVQAMAERRTNTVLMLLENISQPVAFQQYPADGLLFAQNRWHAYYHCHDAKKIDTDEHGHFHLFSRIDTGEWAHVAALSIDGLGQPTQWFTVNRWVTDGPWFESKTLLAQLAYISEQQVDENLVSEWLAAMLQLHAGSLIELLQQRDVKLEKMCSTEERETVLNDRNCYFLSNQKIDLATTLNDYLLDQTQTPETVSASR